MSREQTPPEGLRPESGEFWAELRDLAVWELDAADWRLIDEIAKHSDRLASVGEELSAAGLTVKGSKGQVRPHPLLTTEATLRRQLMREVEAWRERCEGARWSRETNERLRAGAEGG